MRYFVRFTFIGALLLAAGLGGCAVNLGSGNERTIHYRSTGEELGDLKKALDAGAITPEEHEALKKAILDRGHR